jgi:hypothetical protein
VSMPTAVSAPHSKASTAVTLMDATFNGSSDGFYFVEYCAGDGNYVDGYREDGGVLTVAFGGLLTTEPLTDMAGGWFRQFFLNQTSDLTVGIVYQLEIGIGQSASQFVQAQFGLDGTYLGKTAAVNYLAALHGTGIGESDAIGFELATLSIPSVPAGTHTIVLGGYANEMTAQNDTAWVRFDTVTVTATAKT